MAIRQALGYINGSTQEIPPTDQIAIDAGAMKIKPTGAEITRDLAAILGQMVSVLDFGAVPDAFIDPVTGIARGSDNSVAIMKASNAARNGRRPCFFPPGKYYCTQALWFWTDVIGPGVQLIFPNNGALLNKITIENLPGDFGSILLTEVQSWDGWTRHSTKLGNLTNRANQYIWVDTNRQILIDRIGEDDIQFGEGFLVADNEGRLSTPLYGDAKNKTWGGVNAGWKAVRDELRIEGVTVVLAADDTDIGTGRAFYNERPNVKYVGVEVINLSKVSANEYFKDYCVCKVHYENCKIQGSFRVNEAYGWNSDLSALISYTDCAARVVRRAVDANRSKLIDILRPNFPDGWGTHYAWWMGSRDGFVGSTYSGNPQAVMVAGGGFWCINAKMSVAEQTDCAAFRIRPDTAEAGGAMVFTGNTVDMLKGGELVDIQGPAAGSKAGRVLEWPRLVQIEGNTVRLHGATTTLKVLTFNKPWTAVQSPLANDVSGHLQIAGNKFQFMEGGPLLNGAPRLLIEYNKAAASIGDGMTAYIADFPALNLTTLVETGGATTKTARLDATIDRIAGLCMIRWTKGATRRITVGAADVDIAGHAYGADFDSLGDELVQQLDMSGVRASPGLFEVRAGAATASLTPGSFAVTLSKGAAFTCVDPTATGPAVNRVQLTPGVAGAGPKFQVIGTDAIIPMEFGTRGAGPFQFYTSVTVRQFAIQHVAGAVNYPVVQGAADGGDCILGVAGTGTTGHLSLGARGALGVVKSSRPFVLAPYTVGTLPSASTFAGASIRITDRNNRTATSNGSQWLFANSEPVA